MLVSLASHAIKILISLQDDLELEELVSFMPQQQQGSTRLKLPIWEQSMNPFPYTSDKQNSWFLNI